jgi:glucose/arabinose dehydrogenase
MKTALQTTVRLLALLALGLGLAAPSQAQTLKAVRLTAGLSAPLYACAAPGDTTRIFIVQQGGLIRIFKNGSLVPTPFLNVGTKILTGSERGLLGMAFHPNYASNGLFYVSYTRAGDGASIVERYQVSANPDVATPGSGFVMIGPVAQPESNHNGGCIQFGADGMLYYGLGDGGGGNDLHGPIGNGQSGTTMLGKMLRFDVDIASPYIPASNPFTGDPNIRDEIWDLGLRNPWRFSFDRVRGDLFIGDVGQDAREEIDFAPAGSGGRNWGWRCMEGTNCTGLSGCTCNAPVLSLPVDTYTHSFGCSVTGGYIYRGCAIPSLHGTYFYGDYCSARIWSFTYDAATSTKGPTIERTSELAPGGGQFINSITSFGEDGNGELLIVDGGGELFKVIELGQIDCNSNGVADICDLASGSSQDVNGNGIPDECECTAPVVYCSGKFTSSGCAPTMVHSGYSSATLGSGFLVEAIDCMNNKPGLLLYSVTGRAASPFQGGTLCVNGPIKRTPGVLSGGTPAPASDCSGVFSIDFNAYAVGALGGNPLAALQLPGTLVNAQWWGRDPGYPAGLNSQLTNGLEFQVCP